MKPPIYLIESKTCQGLTETFMRFQEYYESPVFKGRVFSRDEFGAWYASEYGAFTYHQDWTGFNIPSWVLEPFRKGDFDPLTDREKNLLNFFKNTKGEFYVIGTTQQDDECEDTIRHEFVHGAFFSCKEYRKDVTECLGDYNLVKIKNALKKMSYENNVLNDETNAYMLTEPETFWGCVNAQEGYRIMDALDKIFLKYFGFSMAAADANVLANRTRKISI